MIGPRDGPVLRIPLIKCCGKVFKLQNVVGLLLNTVLLSTTFKTWLQISQRPVLWISKLRL